MPTILVETPFGKADCLAWYDYDQEGDTEWCCVRRDTGAIVFVPHTDVRFPRNYTGRRLNPKKPPPAPDYMKDV